MTVRPIAPESDQGDRGVLSRGAAALAALLPDGWVVGVETSIGASGDLRADALITIRGPDGVPARVAVDVKQAAAPRDVVTFLSDPLLRLTRTEPLVPVVLFAPWLSPRARDLLTARDVGYLDLTGNVRLHLDRPALIIRTTGAEHNPHPRPRGGVSVRGAVAGRVVRLLADVRPPYTASALAHAAAVSVPYVSRLLTALDRDALVRRAARGLVVDVDWADLLRRRAETYRLDGTNQAQGFVSATGAREVVRRLREEQVPYRAVTGSFAAVQRAPVTAPGQLTVYVDDPGETAEVLGLLPADRGADVVLLTPFDAAVFDGVEVVDGLRVVAPSQLVLDCLTGNGRMPAEGEALLAWMAEDETRWRRPTLDDVRPREGTAR